MPLAVSLFRACLSFLTLYYEPLNRGMQPRNWHLHFAIEAEPQLSDPAASSSTQPLEESRDNAPSLLV